VSTMVRNLALIVASAACVAAQDATPRTELVSVRVVSSQAEGTLEEGQEPTISPELQDWAPLLRKLGLETYRFLERVSQRAPAGTVLRFELPGKLLTEVSGTPNGKSKARKIKLTVKITKPPQQGDQAQSGKRVLVLSTEVLVADGQEIVFRCAEGVPVGELVVIVGASEDPLE